MQFVENCRFALAMNCFIELNINVSAVGKENFKMAMDYISSLSGIRLWLLLLVVVLVTDGI